MNELCKFHEQNLTLYAEDELGDGLARERVERHLQQCPDCQEWVRDYQEFTRQISGEFERDVTRRPIPMTDAERIDTVMAVVRGRRTHRGWSSALRTLAAAGIVVALAGLLWWSWDRGPSDPQQPHVAHHNPVVTALNGGNTILVSGDTSASSRESERFAGDLEIISWLLGDESSTPGATTQADPTDVELLGVVRRYRRNEDGQWFVVADSESSPVRWVLTARLREEFLDPLGGGWTFLVPAEGGSATPVNTTSRDATNAIPLRRVGLQRVSRQRPRYVSHRPTNDDSTHYRIIVVPDERGLGEEVYYRPATALPGGIFRDATDSLPTY